MGSSGGKGGDRDQDEVLGRAGVIGLSEQRIGTAYAMPVRCHVWLLVTDSRGPSGPQVAVLPSLMLSAIQVRVVYRVGRGIQESLADEISLHMPLVAAGERIARPTQVVRGPQGGSSTSLQLFDNDRTALSEERGIGACTDGVREVDLPFMARVNLVAWLAPRGATERPDTSLRLDGELVFLTGVLARVRIRPTSVGKEGPGAVDVDVPLVRPGASLPLAERAIERELPGSPSIRITFMDGEGRPIGRERVVEPTSHA